MRFYVVPLASHRRRHLHSTITSSSGSRRLETGVCSATIPCSVQWFDPVFGFVSLPFMALCGFALIISLVTLAPPGDRSVSPQSRSHRPPPQRSRRRAAPRRRSARGQTGAYIALVIAAVVVVIAVVAVVVTRSGERRQRRRAADLSGAGHGHAAAATCRTRRPPIPASARRRPRSRASRCSTARPSRSRPAAASRSWSCSSPTGARTASARCRVLVQWMASGQKPADLEVVAVSTGNDLVRRELAAVGVAAAGELADAGHGRQRRQHRRRRLRPARLPLPRGGRRRRHGEGPHQR